MTRAPYEHTSPGGWDAEMVFAIVNPLTGYPTCLGEAVTYGRRCKRIVAGHKVAAAQRMIDSLAHLSPLAASNSAKIHDIAEIMLCYQHGGQSHTLIHDWRQQLHQCCEAARRNEEAAAEKKYKARHSGRRTATADDIDDLADKIRMLQDELRRMKAEQQEDYGRKFSFYESNKPKPRYASSMPDSRASDSGYSSTEEEESEDEEDIKARQLREARERAEKAKAEARRKGEADRLAEKRKWSNAWNRYDACWYAMEDGRLQHPRLPWPVLSGDVQDVTESSVRDFFKRAAPVEEDCFRLLTRELKRWHTDKLWSLVGKDAVLGPDRANIDLVTKTVVQLWKETKLSKMKERV